MGIYVVRKNTKACVFSLKFGTKMELGIFSKKSEIGIYLVKKTDFVEIRISASVLCQFISNELSRIEV